MAGLVALSIFTPAGLADIDRGAEARRPYDATTAGDSQTEYLVDVWGTDEGLPNNTVSALAQTPDGYLWCATYDGVVRFDGVRFVRIGPDDPENQQANRVLCLHVDRRGQLWLGTDGAGLLRYAGGKFTRFTEQPAGSSANSVRWLAEDAAGDLWLGTRGGLGRLKEETMTWFTDAAGFTNAAKSIWNLVFDQKGRLWIADWASLKVFEDDHFGTVLSGSEVSMPLRAIYADRDGNMLAGMLGQALRRGPGGQWVSVEEARQFGNSEVVAFCHTRAGDFWVGTRKGLWRRQDGRWTLFTARDGLGSSEVRTIFEDHEGNLWVGTGTGGLARLKRRVLKTYTARHGLTDGSVQALREKPDGGVWVGLHDGRLVHGTGETFQRFEGAKGLPTDAAVKSVLCTRDGALWVGTFGNGLMRFHEGKTTQFVPSVGSPARIDKVTALLEDRAGGVWVGTFYSLYKATGSNVVVPVMTGGRELRSPITALLEARAGGIWVACHGLGVARLTSNSELRTSNSEMDTWLTRREGLPTDLIRTLHEDGAGTLWIGTGAGLACWREGKVSTFTKAHGLADDTISQILEDDADNLWLGSNRGVMRVAKRELHAIAEGRKASLEVFACGRGEGMLSVECSGGFHPAGLKTRDGKLWFPTAKGLVMVDPSQLKLTMNHTPPPVYIEEVRADGKVQTSKLTGQSANGGSGSSFEPGILSLPYGTRRLEFIYTALNLTAPERVRFKHRLDGFDPDWTEAGTVRSAVYTKLPPGRYRFQVIACNNDGIWNETGHLLAFRIAAPFWHMWWFLTLTAIASAGALGAAVRFISVRRLRLQMRQLEQQAALHKERARIAKDIHDDLGANLTQIALLGELARQDQAAPEKAGERVERISITARQAIKSLDEIVWAVNPRNDTLAHLIDYAGQFALDYLRVAGIRCRLDFPERPPDREVSTDVRHNLFLVVKEALHNIVKHAHASEVWLRVTATDEALRMVIEDNGRGFERPSEDAGADGLRNIRQRVAEVGGECRIESHDGAGTRISVQLPWPVRGHAA